MDLVHPWSPARVSLFIMWSPDGYNVVSLRVSLFTTLFHYLCVMLFHYEVSLFTTLFPTRINTLPDYKG